MNESITANLVRYTVSVLTEKTTIWRNFTFVDSKLNSIE